MLCSNVAVNYANLMWRMSAAYWVYRPSWLRISDENKSLSQRLLYKAITVVELHVCLWEREDIQCDVHKSLRTAMYTIAASRCSINKNVLEAVPVHTDERNIGKKWNMYAGTPKLLISRELNIQLVCSSAITRNGWHMRNTWKETRKNNLCSLTNYCVALIMPSLLYRSFHVVLTFKITTACMKNRNVHGLNV